MRGWENTTLAGSIGNASAPCQVVLVPRHGEYLMTMRARQLERIAPDRRPTLAGGAHRVARAPVVRQVDRIGGTGDDGPARRPGEHSLQQALLHWDLLVRHVEHDLVSSHPDHRVPGAAPQCAVDIDPQAGPGPGMVFDRSRHGGGAPDAGPCKLRARAGRGVRAMTPAMACSIEGVLRGVDALLIRRVLRAIAAAASQHVTRTTERRRVTILRPAALPFSSSRSRRSFP